VMAGLKQLSRRFVSVVRLPPTGWQQFVLEPIAGHPDIPPPSASPEVSTPIVNASGSPDSNRKG